MIQTQVFGAEIKGSYRFTTTPLTKPNVLSQIKFALSKLALL